MPSIDDVAPRTRHYGGFYGLEEPSGDGPVVLVAGNCQAESLRIVLDGADIRSVRMPPVHELVAADLPHLDRWLGRAAVLVSQPIRDDYRGLPLGTRQLAGRLGAAARTVLVPVIRHTALHPAHAIIRPPGEPGLEPPLVAYHDLRLLAEAAGTPLPPLDETRVRALAALSDRELTRREARNDAVPISDVFRRPAFDLMRTMNHPGNPMWSELALRVRARLGLAAEVTDPGRPILASVIAPREEIVARTWGLEDPVTDVWTVDGTDIPVETVEREHRRFYAERPDVVEAGLVRHAEALRLLGRS